MAAQQAVSQRTLSDVHSPSMMAPQAEPESSTRRQPLVRSGGEQQPRPRSGEGEQQRPSSSHVAALRSCLHPTRAAATWRQASTHGENPQRPKICCFLGPIWIYMGSWCRICSYRNRHIKWIFSHLNAYWIQYLKKPVMPLILYHQCKRWELYEFMHLVVWTEVYPCLLFLAFLIYGTIHSLYCI